MWNKVKEAKRQQITTVRKCEKRHVQEIYGYYQGGEGIRYDAEGDQGKRRITPSNELRAQIENIY